MAETTISLRWRRDEPFLARLFGAARAECVIEGAPEQLRIIAAACQAAVADHRQAVLPTTNGHRLIIRCTPSEGDE